MHTVAWAAKQVGPGSSMTPCPAQEGLAPAVWLGGFDLKHLS